MANTLNRIEIAGFKSIREMNLELRPINILIGGNGAGKSNVLDAFELLREMMEKRLQIFTARQGGASVLLHFGPKQTPVMTLATNFESGGYLAELASAPGDRFFFETEKCWYREKDQSSEPVGVSASTHDESLMPIMVDIKGERAGIQVMPPMKSWKRYHFHDTSASARIKLKNDIDDNHILRADASNLAAFLYKLQRTHGKVYRKIIMTIRTVAPFFDDFVLHPDPVREDKILLEWRHKTSDDYFNAHALSDGTLRFMCLATLLLQPDPPATILIDEPDIGLHPYAIHQLSALIRGASTRSQIIAATQSVTLMNHFKPEDIVVVEHDGSASTFCRVTREELTDWLDDYTLGELWEKNLLGRS